MTIAYIGLDLTIRCISTLTTSAQGIFLLCNNINKNNIDITYFIKKLDIYADINVLEILLKEIDLEKHYSQTLAMCLKNLQECVSDIELQLIFIHNRINYNKSLWYIFQYKSFKFTDIISELEILKKKLDNRKNLLFDILKINQFINYKHNIPILNIPPLNTDLVDTDFIYK